MKKIVALMIVAIFGVGASLAEARGVRFSMPRFKSAPKVPRAIPKSKPVKPIQNVSKIRERQIEVRRRTVTRGGDSGNADGSDMMTDFLVGATGAMVGAAVYDGISKMAEEDEGVKNE